MKIFVTGITGFIGSNLGKFFSPSDEIYALMRLPKKMDSHGLKITMVIGDLSSPQAIFEALKEIRPDVCIHLAWGGIPDFSYEMSMRNLEENARFLRFLVEVCGCQKVIVAGSCFEYGKAFGPCYEDETVKTNSYFVWAKHALYDLGRLLASMHSISFIWFRFFYVYGPKQRSGSLIPTLATTLIKGERPIIKTPLNANDFIYVEDVAEALVQAAHQEIPTGIYNLGTGIPVPVWKICEDLEMAMNRVPRYAEEMKRSSVQPTANFWADVSKIKSILGWTYRNSLAIGLKQYLGSLELIK